MMKTKLSFQTLSLYMLLLFCIGNITATAASPLIKRPTAKVNKLKAGKPVVVTLAPTGITAFEALFNAQVSANGSPTTVKFEYGTDPNLLDASTITDDGSPSSLIGSATNVAITYDTNNVGNLSDHTDYYYRVTATNSSGTSIGAILSFKTLSNLKVKNIDRLNAQSTASSVALFYVSFNEDVAGNGLSASNFNLTSTGSLVGSTVGNITYDPFGEGYIVEVNVGTGSGDLTLNMANTAGLTAPVINLPFTTGQSYIIDRTPPATPTGISISSPMPNQALLQWTANTEPDFFEYKIYRSPAPNSMDSYGSLKTNTLTDNGLTAGANYYYRISAIDNLGNESALSVDFQIVNAKVSDLKIGNKTSPRSYGLGPIDLNVTTSNQNTPIIYKSSDPTVATYINGVLQIVHAGTTEISVEQAGDATYLPGLAKFTLKVNPATLSFTISGGSKFYGDLDPILGTVNGTVNGDVITLVRASGQDVGNYAITAIGNNLSDYNIPLGSQFTILQRTINVAIDSKEIAYGDNEPSLTYTISPATLPSGEVVSSKAIGSLERLAGTNAGLYPISIGTLNFGNNYLINSNVNYLGITKRSIAIKIDNQIRAVGDTDPPLTYQIAAGNLVNGDQFTGFLVRASGEAEGLYPITKGSLSLSDNYIVTFQNAYLKIGKYNVVVTPAINQGKTYGQNEPTITFTSNLASLGLSDTFSGSLSRSVGENVGSYAINMGSLAITNPAFYNITIASSQFTVNPKEVKVDVNNTAKIYGDGDPAINYTYNAGDIVNGETFTGALSRVGGENAGLYPYQVGNLSLGNNYQIVVNSGALTINQREITVSADAASKTYGDADPTLSYQIKTGGLKTGDAFTGALARANGQDVGTYALNLGSLTAGPNYLITLETENLTITPKTISVIADSKTKVYGSVDPALTYSLANGPLPYGDSFTGSLGRTNNENVGAYAIVQNTLALSSNYNLQYTGNNLVITPMQLTVKADAKYRAVVGTDPPLTYQITAGNLVGGDVFTGSLIRTIGEVEGEYDILQNNLDVTNKTNYNLNYLGAKFTITNKTIQTINFAALQDKTYGDADFDLTATSSAGLTVNYISSNPTVATVTGNKVHLLRAGTVIITAEQLGDANNTSASVGQSLTINKLPLTIMADAKTKNFGDADPVFTYQTTPAILVGTDNISGTLSRMPGTTAGQYAINIGSLAVNGGDYAVTYVGANLTILAATPQNITFNAISNKVYGNADFDLVATSDSSNPILFSSSDPSVATVTGATVKILKAGVVIFYANQLADASHSAATQVQQQLTIDKRPITVTADAQNKKTTAIDPIFSYQVSAGSVLPGDNFVGMLSRVAGTVMGVYPITIGTLDLGPNYAITFVSADLTVQDKGPQTITFGAISGITYGDGNVNLNATANSGLPVVFTSSNINIATISGNKMQILHSGSVTIFANQVGDAETFAAPQVAQVIDIAKKPITYTADPKSKLQFDNDPLLTGDITAGSLVFGTAINGVLSRDPGEAPGDYNINKGTLYFNDASGPVNDYILNYVPAKLTIIPKQTQTLSFTALANVTYGDAASTLNATSDKGLSPVNYASSDPTIAMVTGNTLTILRAGQITLTATQPGDATYGPAQASQVVNIAKRAITITADSYSKKVIDPDPSLTFTVTKGTVVTGDFFAGGLTRQAGIIEATYVISRGSLNLGLKEPNYDITFVNGTLTIANKLAQNILFSAIPTKEYGDADFVLVASTNAPLGIVYTTTNPSIATVTGNLVHIVSTGTVTINANQAGDVNYAAAPQQSQTLSVKQRAIYITADAKGKLFGDPEPALTYTYTGSIISPDQFSGSLSRDPGTNVGQYNILQGTLSINANYALYFTGAKFTITDKKSQILTFPAIADKVYGASDFNLSATSDAGLPITYTGSNNAVATISNNVVHIVGSGAVTFTANQLGDANYFAALQQQQSFVVSPMAISINALPQSKFLGDIDPKLTYEITTGKLVGNDQFTGELSRVVGETIGSYAISQGSLALNSNYIMSFVPANLTISLKPISSFKLEANNILSPNGDGKNDFLEIKNLAQYPPAKITIMDREGRVLMQTDHYKNDWTGMQNGSPLATNTYYYILDFGAAYGKQRGFITIVNN